MSTAADQPQNRQPTSPDVVAGLSGAERGGMTAAALPEIRTNGDEWIARELGRVRLQQRLLGELPAFRRGRLYFNYEAGKVCIAPVEGGDA